MGSHGGPFHVLKEGLELFALALGDAAGRVDVEARVAPGMHPPVVSKRRSPTPVTHCGGRRSSFSGARRPAALSGSSCIPQAASFERFRRPGPPWSRP